MNTVRFGTACIALALVFSATGCSSSDDSSSNSSTNTSSSDNKSKGSSVDAFAAVKKAEALFDGVVVELSQGTEKRTAVWEVGILLEDGSGAEVYLDRNTGDEVERDSFDLSREQRTAPQVNAKSAMESALESVPGKVTELDLDTDRLRVVWEIVVEAEAGGEFDVYVDAETAKVVREERAD